MVYRWSYGIIKLRDYLKDTLEDASLHYRLVARLVKKENSDHAVKIIFFLNSMEPFLECVGVVCSVLFDPIVQKESARWFTEVYTVHGTCRARREIFGKSRRRLPRPFQRTDPVDHGAYSS